MKKQGVKKESANDRWKKQREKLKVIFQEKGMTRCELCGSNFILSFHHRHKRWLYIRRKELLGDFNQVILVYAKHHELLERDKELTEYYFKKLRCK